MRWVRRSVYAAAVILALASTLSAASVTLYGNLEARTDGQDGVTASALGPLADSFSTGGTALNLTDVKVKLVIVGQRSENGIIEATLHSDNGGPGVGGLERILGRVPDMDVGNTPAVFDFSDFPAVALAANTRYWIELNDNGTESKISWC
jgi:hypothetical protein